MTSPKHSDPRPLLAIFAALVVFSISSAISNIDTGAVLDLAERLAPFALGAVAIASALAPQRIVATRRTLRSRRLTAVVPADEFDAKPEVVLSFAAQLASSERSIAGWLDRRASALRMQLACDSEHRLVYLIEVPDRAAGLLRSALRSYEGVELRSAEDVLSDSKGREKTTTLRTELVLAHSSIEPLARFDGDPDPLQAFAAAVASLHPERGEAATVCLDLLPATGRRRGRLRRRLFRQARRRHREGSRWGELLGSQSRGRDRARPDELLDRRLAGQALDAKLRDSGPLFEAQVLLRCQAPDRPRAKAMTKQMLAAFELLTDRNWLRASGLPMLGLAFLGSDLPIRRRSFDRRLASGYFRPAQKMILTAREVAGFLKPPTVNCRAENVMRSGALLAPPPPLPSFDPKRKDLIPLGKVSGEDGERLVGVRVADTFFSYTAGRSRYGKTESAIVQFVHLVRSGYGGFFLDPHGDALDRIAPYLAEPGIAERVVRIDLRPGATLDELPGWNLFEVSGANPAEAEARVEAVVDAFASALEWGERSTRAINLTTQAASALARIAPLLAEDGLAPTIFQIPTLLSDAEWRADVLPFLPQASQRFWRDRFPLLATDAITPVTNMIDRLRASSAITALLGQARTTYRVREAMDEGLIVLACPGAGGTRDRLVANLLVFDLFHAARSRAELAPGDRRLFWPFFDEVQSYDGAASGNLAALLEQSAKFGLRAHILNQNPERLSPATLNALLTNRSHLLASALNSHAAGLLTKEWAGQPSPAALTKLDRFRFVAQVTDQGRASRPFSLRGIRLEDVFGEADRRQARPEGRRPSGSSAAETFARLERHDERIRAKLREARGRRGGGRGSASGPVSHRRRKSP
ncbi:MAG TPA: hypothetical protein VFN85_09155 [Solirubrobacterales bacterium]|nr:hypothetical protein [Solirubrobacterales bacterium]